jgi:branched-chain amino acid transport system ATP-binding protein
MLIVRALSKSFGGIRAVANVDLSLAQGELRCLIGPNGAGKSTLFRLIMGLTRPDAGSVIVDGKDITWLQPFRRVAIGLSMKYQTTRVFGDLTVDQNVKIACASGVKGEELVRWGLASLGLDEFSTARASTLSYGQQHWLELCMVMGSAPRVILMDEPTAGMTPEETGLTVRFVHSLGARDIAVIIIEHDMAFVREIDSGITVLHQGAVFREGRLRQIEHDPEVQRIYLGEGNGRDAA